MESIPFVQNGLLDILSSETLISEKIQIAKSIEGEYFLFKLKPYFLNNFKFHKRTLLEWIFINVSVQKYCTTELSISSATDSHPADVTDDILIIDIQQYYFPICQMLHKGEGLIIDFHFIPS